MTTPYEVSLDVVLQYSQAVEADKVAEWLQNSLEHCRQEGMLSGDVTVAGEEDLCCEGIRVSLNKGDVAEE